MLVMLLTATHVYDDWSVRRPRGKNNSDSINIKPELFEKVLISTRRLSETDTGVVEFPLNHVSCGSGIPNAVQVKLADCVWFIMNSLGVTSTLGGSE